MNWFSKKASGWPIIAIGLILVGLWGTLFIKQFNNVDSEVQGAQKQALYGNVLPNFLAPVIREEVRKEPVAEQENVTINLPVQGVSNFIKVLIKE